METNFFEMISDFKLIDFHYEKVVPNDKLQFNFTDQECKSYASYNSFVLQVVYPPHL